MADDSLTVAQAYEAAYRYVAQYRARELESESLLLMMVAMRPDPPYESNDPASWHDFLDCVCATRAGEPLPSPFREDGDGTAG